MNVQEQVQAVGRGKQRLYVEGLCLDVEEVENQNILPRKSVKQRLGICGPGVQRGPSPQRVNLDSRPSGQILSWAAMEGQFLGGQCCQCGRLGLRLLGQGDGWESHALTARPPRRTSFTPNSLKKGFTRQAQVPTKEVLDQQLDDYMSMSKRYLDSQLDAYMALAGYLDGEDENKWLDIEGV
ncbi:hypothetical protein NHX12_000900 [Muraenolepis orangiensis]|uniref:Chromatin target of PRMT1 protein C-terminal domain-containing protein n=1 Tax=Muraenolepis orangiensis TaxID=630683 RepID=A0A9Q0IEF9_9TELE|nr:hypothetical protein NHX12_000900 [Muraenolepis orangiensis]